MHRLKKLIIGGYICILVFLVMTFFGYCDSENLTFSMSASFTSSMIAFILTYHVIY